MEIGTQIAKMAVDEFIETMKERSDRKLCFRHVFFLGAGCSISSDVPGAAKLTEEWLSVIKNRKGDNDYDSWIKKEFPDFKPTECAKYYSKVIKAAYPLSEERQQEIEEITKGKYPDIGYRILASLISDKKYGEYFNIILTTNFDDILATAFYLNTNDRPLVILHDSLIEFTRDKRKAPTIIKLHGDAKIFPKNLEAEIGEIAKPVKEAIKKILGDSILVFIGYGGNDTGITNLLKEIKTLNEKVFWINSKLPDGAMLEWLDEIKAYHIQHCNFNELMLKIAEKFNLEYSTDGIEGYFENNMKYLGRQADEYKQLCNDESNRIDTYNNVLKNMFGKEKQLINKIKEYLEKAAFQLSYWELIRIELERAESESEKAGIYKKEIEKNNENPYILCEYADFLLKNESGSNNDIRNNYKDAVDIVKRRTDSSESGYIKEDLACFRKYAEFLWKEDSDYEEARNLYEKIEISNNESLQDILSRTAFLQRMGKDEEDVYKKIEGYDISKEDDKTKYEYAFLLKERLPISTKVQVIAKELCENNPENPEYLYLYAFVLEKSNEFDKSIDREESIKTYYEKAIDLSNNKPEYILVYLNYLESDLKKNKNDLIEIFEKTIIHEVWEKDPVLKSDIQGRNAFFTEKILKDDEKAYKLYKNAFHHNPYNINNTLNYAGILFKKKRHKEAFEVLDNYYQTGDEYELIQNLYKLVYGTLYYSNNERIRRTALSIIKNKITEKYKLELKNFNAVDNIVKYLRKSKPKERKFLFCLLKVIFKGNPIERLEKYTEWQEIG